MADPSSADGSVKELVSNPRFSEPGTSGLPAGWTRWTPAWSEASCTVRSVSGGLLMEAPRRPFAVGGVSQEIVGIAGGNAYAVEAVCRLRGISASHRSVLLRVIWTQGRRPVQPAGLLCEGHVSDGEMRFGGVFTAPLEADGARLSLELKWPRGGWVVWERVSLKDAPPPQPRKVRLGTVYLRPQNSTPERNLDLFCEQIDAAGRLGLDIVCLPEAMTMIGTGRSYGDCAEPIPGRATERLGAAAARNRIWVVAGLFEQEGERLYNTAVLLDRQGRVAGKYRKVHVPREEWRQGITPGEGYPIFQTDFGTVAIQICYDCFFPEPEAIFALGGAEIIFAPTWGTTFPDQGGRVEGENLFRVRARDNGVYMIPSVYDGNSLVIDPLGRILASSNGGTGVFWCEVDLNARESLPWVGNWRSIGPRDRMPDTYGPLLNEP